MKESHVGKPGIVRTMAVRVDFREYARALARTAYAGAPVRIGTGSFVGFMVAATAVARIGLPEPALPSGWRPPA
jgi:hypothetical protein